MDGLQLNPRAKPFVATPQDRGRHGSGNHFIGQQGLSGCVTSGAVRCWSRCTQPLLVHNVYLARHQGLWPLQGLKELEQAGSHLFSGRGRAGSDGTGQVIGGRGRSAGGVRSMQPIRSRALNRRTVSQKQMAESVRRTMYICDIDQQARADVPVQVRAELASEPHSRVGLGVSAWAAQVTEEQLAGAFQDCGQVVDCRMCGDPNSAMRFAFIEFYHEDSVQKVGSLLAWVVLHFPQLYQALFRIHSVCNRMCSPPHPAVLSTAWPLNAWCWQAIATMNGARVGAYPLRVLPSKTAIVPVNNHFLPRTPEERELCGRTVYVANIDKKVDKQHVLAFFEKHCGACMCARSAQTAG